jgi:MSHA biogenesis protein MshM
MYQTHFGLSELPFSLTPDTQFYVDLPSHREALNVLLLALQNGEGFIKITGPVGSGKTMLCRKLLNELPAPFQTLYIPNPHLAPNDLLFAIADELGLNYRANTQINRIQHQINHYLLKAAANGIKPVVIIDEAQAMPLETLEALRLLSNLETEKQKLLQIILFGQSELNELLNHASIRQLKQRISFSYNLKPLSKQDVQHYLHSRLRCAEADNPDLFNQSTAYMLHRHSQGILRLVNLLAHKSLLSAYGKGSSYISAKHVRRALQDTAEALPEHSIFMCRPSFLIALLTALLLFMVNFPEFRL